MDSRMFSPALTNLEMNMMGRRHYRDRSIKERIYFSMFCCHDDGEQQAAFDLMHYHQDSHPSDKWIYLARSYARLPSNQCSLAQDIRTLIRSRFQASNIRITKNTLTRTRYGNFVCMDEVDTAVVAAQMEKIILEQAQQASQAFRNL